MSEDLRVRHRQMGQSLNAENINEILTYTLNKLLKDYQIKTEDSENSTSQLPAIHLRIFYQVNNSPNVDFLTSTLQEFKNSSSHFANLAFTVIPACGLHNYNTFLSICGLRYE